MTDRPHDQIDDQFRDPERGKRKESGQAAKDESGNAEGRAGLPDHFQQRRNIPERLESLSPGLGNFGGLGRRWPHPATWPARRSEKRKCSVLRMSILLTLADQDLRLMGESDSM